MTEFLDTCYKAINKQANAIPATLENVDISLLEVLKGKRLIFTGCGDSYAVADYGKWAFLAASRDSLVLSPPEVSMVSLDANSVVVGITASGRSIETIAALKRAKVKGAETVVLTDDKKGAASEFADHIWLTRSGVGTYNTSPSAPTTAAMVFLMKLAAFDRENIHTDLMHDIQYFEDERNVNQIIYWAEKVGKEIAEVPGIGDLLYFISEGPNFVAAQIGMMKFNEYSIVKGTSAMWEEFRHHYNLSIKEGNPAVFITDNRQNMSKDIFRSVLSDTLKMRVYHLFCPTQNRLETSQGQAIANSIVLQLAAYYNVLKYDPEKKSFKMPHAEAFRIY
jgi:glucosamine--fructose-6-phosphate aminotransferase (isomerizing)